MRHWFGLDQTPSGAGTCAAARAPAPAAARPCAATVPDADEDCPWPAERLELVDALWGEGFQFPGGEAETMRLVKPLGLSAATSLLVLGAGSGGPPCCIASDLGVWVTGYESDQEPA